MNMTHILLYTADAEIDDFDKCVLRNAGIIPIKVKDVGSVRVLDVFGSVEKEREECAKPRRGLISEAEEGTRTDRYMVGSPLRRPDTC
jgi:hypothetical protein